VAPDFGGFGSAQIRQRLPAIKYEDYPEIIHYEVNRFGCWVCHGQAGFWAPFHHQVTNLAVLKVAMV
jgi:hypothetical protein